MRYHIFLLFILSFLPLRHSAAQSTENPLISSLEKTCCRVCVAGKACGDSCISASYNCSKGSGCACNGGGGSTNGSGSGGSSTGSNGGSNNNNGGSNSSPNKPKPPASSVITGTYSDDLKISKVETNDPLRQIYAKGQKVNFKLSVKRKSSTAYSSSMSKPYKLNMQLSNVKSNSFTAKVDYETDDEGVRGLICAGVITIKFSKITSDSAKVSYSDIETCGIQYKTELKITGTIRR